MQNVKILFFLSNKKTSLIFTNVLNKAMNLSILERIQIVSTHLYLHLVDRRGFPAPHGVVLEEGAIKIHLQFRADLFLVETRQGTDARLQHEHQHHHEHVLMSRRGEMRIRRKLIEFETLSRMRTTNEYINSFRIYFAANMVN